MRSLFRPTERRSTFDAKEIAQFAFDALMDKKLRTGVTIAMVVVGATLVTSLNGMSQGMNGFINQQLSTIAANVVVILPGQISFSGGMTAPPRMVFTEQTRATVARFPGVEMVFPFYRSQVNVNSMGFTQSEMVLGVDMHKLVYVNPTLSAEQGGLLSPDDSLGIVFGHNVAYPKGWTRPFVLMGQTVTLEYSYVDSSGPTPKSMTVKKGFQVRGILNEVGTQYRDDVVYVSPSAANSLLAKAGKYDGLYIITKSPDVDDMVQKQLLSFYGTNNIGIYSPQTFADLVGNVISGFSMFMRTIGLISMIVGAIGIVTTQYTTVLERVREIGILKAIGFDNRLILTNFLCESAAIGVIGGTLGIVVGSLAAQVVVQNLPVTGVFFLRASSPILTPLDLASTWFLAVGLAVLAGLYPAWKASKMDPVESLRAE